MTLLQVTCALLVAVMVAESHVIRLNQAAYKEALNPIYVSDLNEFQMDSSEERKLDTVQNIMRNAYLPDVYKYMKPEQARKESKKMVMQRKSERNFMRSPMQFGPDKRYKFKPAVSSSSSEEQVNKRNKYDDRSGKPRFGATSRPMKAFSSAAYEDSLRLKIAMSRNDTVENKYGHVLNILKKTPQYSSESDEDVKKRDAMKIKYMKNSTRGEQHSKEHSLENYSDLRNVHRMYRDVVPANKAAYLAEDHRNDSRCSGENDSTKVSANADSVCRNSSLEKTKNTTAKSETNRMATKLDSAKELMDMALNKTLVAERNDTSAYRRKRTQDAKRKYDSGSLERNGKLDSNERDAREIKQASRSLEDNSVAPTMQLREQCDINCELLDQSEQVSDESAEQKPISIIGDIVRYITGPALKKVVISRKPIYA